eukprot:evm.model.scf_21EXC.21 EVM.evm.TU.scf_21EXC.21   scf_21EXC:199623-202678(-)
MRDRERDRDYRRGEGREHDTSGRIVYVGNLPLDVKHRELEDLFYKYGRIRNVDLKLPPRPPGFAFVEFDDPRDAMDAVRGRDGYEFLGNRLRVEVSHGGGRGYYRSQGSATYGMSRRTEFRIIVTGLPSSCSWQDLKDHMRKAGDVTFAQVMRPSRGYDKGMRDRDGMMGLVDYASYEDMKHAVRKLDDSEFRNPFDKSFIRVREDRGGRSPRSPRSPVSSRSRSRSHSRTRSRSRCDGSISANQSC